jgi:hypothetical protein
MDFQPEQITFNLLYKPACIGIALGFILAFVFSLTGERSYWDKVKTNIFPALGYSIPISMVAYIAGYLTGISRSPAVDSVVPAVLALIAGLNIYFFGIESRSRALVGYSVVVFSIVFFYGIWAAVIHREGGRVGRFISLSEQEKAIVTYRQNRGLSPDVPEWILGSNPR